VQHLRRRPEGRDRTRIVDRETPKRPVGPVLRGAASRPNRIGLVGAVDLAPGRTGDPMGARMGSIPGAAAGPGLPRLAIALLTPPGDD
jgi:hypothetical protein